MRAAWSAISLIAVLFCGVAVAQKQEASLSSAAKWAVTASENYLIYPDQVYGRANNYELKLDVWQRKDSKVPPPTLIYYHGGGWIFGDRTGATLFFLPYLEMGWNVINVEYRMANVSLAPAAVEDCRCALRWVLRNAKQYNVDINKIVLTGHSAGGHLALIVGMLPNDTGLDNECYGTEELKVAAIINWYGVTDVADIITPPDSKNYALMWMGSRPDQLEIAKRVSPLTYVRHGVPPVLTIHGDADTVVPYEHAVKLHAALAKAGVANELLTIRGGWHGQFTSEQLESSYLTIRSFLRQRGLIQ